MEAETLTDSFELAHSEPHFNLADEPWIPVSTQTPSGNKRLTVSLRDLLLKAHEIEDITEPEPLTRAAIRRFLIDITTLAIRSSVENGSTLNGWKDRFFDNSGFTVEEVDRTLENLRPHLWLFHPERPFMQRIALTGFVEDSYTVTTDDLVPYIPGKDAGAWSIRPNDPIVGKGHSEAEAAIGLLYRQMYLFLGNGGGGEVGGIYSEGMANVTHVFRRTPHLFTTLLANLTTDKVTPDDRGDLDGVMWASTLPVSAIATPLYLGSLIMTNALLGPVEESGRINVLRRALMGTKKQKDADKEIMKTALEGDPHRMRVVSKKTYIVRLPASEHHLEQTERLLGGVIESDTIISQGIVNPAFLWLGDTAADSKHELELILSMKSGTGSSPKLTDTAIVHIPTLWVDMKSEKSQNLQTLMGGLLGRKGALYGLKRALGQSVYGDSVSLAQMSEKPWATSWLYEADRQIGLFLADQATREEVMKSMRNKSLELFDRETAAYVLDPNKVKNIVEQRGYLLRSKTDV